VSAVKSSAGAVEVAGVRLTNPDKVLYPEQGTTKLELARYYLEVERWILPHLANRPLTLVRCPQGRAQKCFYQKHVSGHEPKSIHRLVIAEKEGSDTYMAVREIAGVVALVQLGVLELHLWGSHADRVDKPDRMVIDLDPAPGVPFGRVTEAALDLRERFGESGLESFAMTTGGKGLHVVLPIQRGPSFDEVKAFARSVAERLAKEHPREFVAQMSKARREGRIFVDYLRNARGATAICPYSTRARPGCPVATPLRWEEVTGKLEPAKFDLHTVPKRMKRAKRDPWEGYGKVRQRLTSAAKGRWAG
jgi:bifunctional non-homologous end joining protein LigD